MAIQTGFSSTGQRLLGIQSTADLEALGVVLAGLTRTAADRPLTAPPPAALLPGRSPDISNWDVGTVDGTCFRANGVQRVYIGVQNPAIAEQQYRTLSPASISVESPYCFHYYAPSTTQPQRVTEIAIQKAIDWRAPVVTLDAEADSAATTAQVRNQQLRECVRMVLDAKKHCRIYTAPWWWVPMHANTPEFAEMGCSLWHAAYGANDCRMPPMRAVNYGGWTYCVIHQYCSTDGFCNRPVRDANHAWSDSIVVPEDDDMGMTPAQEKLLLGLATIVNGPANGQNFASVDEAWAALEPLVTNDIILLRGLAGTQAKVGQLIQDVGKLGEKLDIHLADPHANVPHIHRTLPGEPEE